MKILFVFVVLLSSIHSMAQTYVLDQGKYWDYRIRLKDQYIDIGEGKGKSIPAEYYNPKKRELHWGDGTMALGWYIGILATEYQLSSKKGYIETGEGKAIDPRQTLIELSYALAAVDRLDLASETFFDKSKKGELNGFLLRDDVGEENKSKFKNVDNLTSDYTSYDPFNNEMSQDQVFELMIGLALVKNFIPEKTQVGDMFLNKTAVDQAQRILSQLQNNNWRLKNPVAKEPSGRKNKKVKRGHQAFIYSKGIQKMMYYFGGAVLKTSVLYDIYWASLRMGWNPTYADNSNASMAMAIAAVGNGFEKNTYRKLVKRARKNDWYIYPLLNKAIYPLNREIKSTILEDVQAMINEAPSEGIVSNFDRESNHSWGVNNRFYKFKKIQKKGLYYQVDRAYNGMDFMLLYNLWLIHRTGLYKDAWRLLAPRTCKEKRADRKARRAYERNEKNIEIQEEP